MQVQKVIEQLGYTSKEAKVYLAALGLGEAHISDIAAKVQMPRSSVQLIVDKLHNDGLMNFYVQRRYKYWVAEKPERLIDQLRSREEMVQEALPELARLKKPSGIAAKPVVKVFTGRDEIAHILDDIIDTHQHIDAIIPEDQFAELFQGTSSFEDFTQARIRNFLRIRVLAPNTPVGRALAERGSKELREIRFLPDRVHIKTASLMYGSKVALVIFNQKQPTAVLIENQAIHETKVAMFEELWNRGDRSEAAAVAPREELFRVLADASELPVLIANEEAEIEYVNAAWQEQFGYALKEVRGQNPRMLQSGKTPRDIYSSVWKAIRAGKMFQSGEIVDKRKDGSSFRTLTTVFPLRSGNELHYVQILNETKGRERAAKAKKGFSRKPGKAARPRS